MEGANSDWLCGRRWEAALAIADALGRLVRMGGVDVEGEHPGSAFLEGSDVARMMRGSKEALGRGEVLT